MFTSRIFDQSVYASPHLIRTSLSAVRAASTPAHGDRLMGLWWGHSSRVPDLMDPFVWDPLDVDSEAEQRFIDRLNVDDRAGAMVELGYAIDNSAGFGADLIGLDEFQLLVPWEGYFWLQDLQQAAPNAKFITEGKAVDIMHVLSPAFDYMFAGSPAQFRHLNPCMIADFLNPNHEYWLYLVGACPASVDCGVAEELEQMLREHAARGFVLVLHNGINIDTTEQGAGVYLYRGAESWLDTVPNDLRP